MDETKNIEKEVKITAELQEEVEAELKVPDPEPMLAIAKIKGNSCQCKTQECQQHGKV